MPNKQSREDLPPHQITPRVSTPESCLPGQRLSHTCGWPLPQETPQTASPRSTGPAHPPPTLCQRCKWKNWASVQTSRDQNHLQVSGNSPWSPGPHKAASTSTEEKGVVYRVSCADCDCVYIGETGRTLEKKLSEHRWAVKRNDLKNGIAVHTWKTQHKVDWEAATVKQVETNYTQWKITEAIHIKKQKVTSNLDYGRSLNYKFSTAASPLLTLAPSHPPPPTQTTWTVSIYSGNMHYIIITSHITPCYTAPILATVFLSHVSLDCCTSWERSPDQNVLDICIELLFVNPAAAILLLIWSPDLILFVMQSSSCDFAQEPSSMTSTPTQQWASTVSTEQLSGHWYAEQMPSRHQEYVIHRRKRPWPRSSRGMDIQSTSSTSTPVCSPTGCLYVTERCVLRWPTPISMDCLSPSIGC